MASALRLVGISGSLRASSFNTGILRYAAANAPENVELEIANIDFPLYNGDVEAASGLPDGVTALADQVRPLPLPPLPWTHHFVRVLELTVLDDLDPCC